MANEYYEAIAFVKEVTRDGVEKVNRFQCGYAWVPQTGGHMKIKINGIPAGPGWDGVIVVQDRQSREDREQAEAGNDRRAAPPPAPQRGKAPRGTMNQGGNRGR